MLKYGSPESVGLLSDAFEDLKNNLTEYMTPSNYGPASNNEVHPLYPGATVMWVVTSARIVATTWARILSLIARRIGHESTVVSHFAVGHTFKYADENGTEVPKEQQIETEKDTIYDGGFIITARGPNDEIGSLTVASLTKMFTTIAALQQLETGKIALDATVASYVPDFASGCDSLSCYILNLTWCEL